MSEPVHATVRKISDIPGWFSWTDQQLFRVFLDRFAPADPGHLVELGVYLGKSAVLIGEYQRPEERFVVNDLFGDAVGLANAAEVQKSYGTLTRERFEANYRALRGDLPEIVQAPSSSIVDHLPPTSVRFLHVDASHLYEHVRDDVASAVRLLRPDGVVVFDDIRSAHTPGVAAAVWGAVERGELVPVVISPSKLYAVLADPDPVTARVLDWLREFGRLRWELQEIAGHRVVRVATLPSTDPAKSKAIDQRLTALEKTVQSGFATSASGSSALDRRLADLDRDLTALDRGLANLQAQAARGSLPERVLRRGWRSVRRATGRGNG